MSNLLKFEPEPFDNEFLFESESEQEDEIKGRRASSRSGQTRKSTKSPSGQAPGLAGSRQGLRTSGPVRKGAAGRWAQYPAPVPAYFRGRRRWAPGVVDVDVSPVEGGSEHVRWAQTCLNSFLGINLPIDGVMSAPVRSAVRTFQERRGLPINGLIGPETETALRDTCRPAEAPPLAAREEAPPPEAPAQEIDTSSAPPGTTDALTANIVRVAKEELARWNYGRIKETDPRSRDVLRDYWKTGTGNVFTAAQIASPSFQAATPWSAAFISWVMRKAGAGGKFKYSASHSVYTAAAKANRIAQNDSPFKAYRISEVTPRVGDLVCKSRAGSGATYDTIRPGMKTHCDIVTGAGPDGLEVVGGNVSNSVSKGRVHLDSAGHIKDPNYFAVIRIDGAQPAVLPKVPGPVATQGAAPRLLKREIVPAGTTLYLEINLEITDKFGITAPPMTGVFIPHGYTPQGNVDIILYLHGHKGGEMRKQGIDQYWNAKKFPYGAFREGLNKSERRAILVAPSLGSRSEAGRLVSSGGLDAFMGQVLAGIGAYGGAQGKVMPGNLFLACHSGGGAPMRRLSGGSDAILGNLQECWGFDCTYNGGDDTFWAGWAQRAPRRTCYFYYIPGSQTARLAEAMRDKNVRNAIVIRSAELRHNYVPLRYWEERLLGASSLTSRLGGSAQPSVVPSVPTGEPDDVKSLSHPAFIAFVGRHAQDAMAATGVPASVTIAQAILETGWGKHTIGDARNLFGIKGKGPAGSIRVPTREFVDGKWITIQANFAKYNSFAESILEHARFLLRNKRYALAFKVKDDADAFARAIHKAGYATAPAYSTNLITLMKKYRLYSFDSRVEMAKSA
jgi:hypothetical protein